MFRIDTRYDEFRFSLPCCKIYKNTKICKLCIWANLGKVNSSVLYTKQMWKILSLLISLYIAVHEPEPATYEAHEISVCK